MGLFGPFGCAGVRTFSRRPRFAALSRRRGFSRMFRMLLGFALLALVAALVSRRDAHQPDDGWVRF
jgi:hypothetical protein